MIISCWNNPIIKMAQYWKILRRTFGFLCTTRMCVVNPGQPVYNLMWLKSKLYNNFTLLLLKLIYAQYSIAI